MLSPIETLLATLYKGREKITIAYDAAERGTVVDTLLQHVDEVMLPDALAPIYRADLTQDDLEAVHRALFVPLAVIEGAIAVSAGTVLEHTLQEAHALLDWCHNQMDAAGEIARSLPDVNVKARDFERGKEIAINMMADAEALMDEREGMRWMRGGKAQDNLVKGYLTDIIDEPALIDGFTAILSATIRNDQMDWSELRKITLAETQAGELGADGTEQHPDHCAPASVRTNSPNDPVENDASARLALASEAIYEVSKLAEGMTRLLEIERDDDYLIYHGMLARIQQCSDIIFFAVGIDGTDDRTLSELERAFKGML